MIDPGNVQTIARKELRDALRNRWFALYTLAFGGLALTLSALSHPGGGLADLAGYGRTAASLVNLVLLFVPLIGLTLGAANLAGERETGALDYLLTQPVTRPEVLLGKYAGLAMALLASLGLGFGLAGVFLALRGQGGDPGGYILTVLIAWLLGLAMLSLGLLLSIVARRTSAALVGSLFLWLALVFLGDLGIMGAAIITRLPIEQVLLLASFNPLQLFKMAAILTIQANLEVLGPAGLYATDRFGSALLPLLVGGLLIWVLVPLASALILFARQGSSRREQESRIMKVKVFLLSVALLVAAGCAQVAAEVQPASDVAIDLTVEPSPPAAGEATLIVTVTDAAGRPVDGATVHVHGNMDHAGMEPVDSETTTSEAGVYRVPFNWTMGGGWILDVTVSLPDNRGTATQRFELFVEAVSHDSILRGTTGDVATEDESTGASVAAHGADH